MNKPHLSRAFIYFAISLVLTTMFVLGCPLYISQEQLLLSLSIAGGKWMIQLFLAVALLRKRRSSFIHGMGRVCLIGSAVLIPNIISSWLDISDDTLFFFGSLVLAILVMVFRYYAEVARLNLSLGWWYSWLLSLALAFGLQITVVFHLF